VDTRRRLLAAGGPGGTVLASAHLRRAFVDL
jgi:hypothetical protein